jgi:tripartite-type tricarboxylate transporter receptor subunit TctC
MFDSITSARPHIQSGKLRPLAVTTTRRSAALPDVPTMAEAGITGYDVSPWFAVFARAGTPAHVIARLNKGLNEAMQQPETLRKFESIGAEPIGSTPQELASHLGKELERWDRLIRQRGVRAD